jgi:uncharacterized membrane protein
MRPLWLDESYSAWFSSQSWQYLWTVAPTFETHPPFYYSLLKAWRGLFGGDAAALRSLSVVFDALTIVVVMAAALEHERISPAGRPLLRAGAAGFLAACSPVLVLLGQEARPYPLLVLAFGTATLGMLRLMRDFANGGPGKWSSWMLLAVGVELTLWAHALGILYAFCLLAALVPAWLKPPLEPARLTRGTAVGATVGLIYLPCLLMMLSRTGDWGDGWLSWRPGMLLQLVGLYSVPFATLPLLAAPAALVMILLIKRVVGEALRGRGWTPDRVILVLWLGPPLLAALISIVFAPVFLLRTLAGTLVPAYLAMATALARTPSSRERAIFVAALVITLLPIALKTAVRPPSERWDGVASYLSRAVSPKDQVWLYPNDTALPLAHTSPPIAATARPIPAAYPAIGKPGPVRAGSPAVVSVTREQAANVAGDPKLRQVPVIWLVTRQGGIFDPNGDLASALAQVRRPGPAREWGYIAVRPYYRR